MSTRSALRSTVTALTTVATAAVLVGVTGSFAAADPPALDSETCSTTLARAAAWPGALSADTHLVSDGFVSYLSRQPVCDPGAALG